MTDHLTQLLAAVNRWQHETSGIASRALIETKDRILRELAEQGE